MRNRATGVCPVRNDISRPFAHHHTRLDGGLHIMHMLRGMMIDLNHMKLPRRFRTTAQKQATQS
jgi:hypothetical protein